MFVGHIRNSDGAILFTLGPYLYANKLVEDLLEFGPELLPGHTLLVEMVTA